MRISNGGRRSWLAVFLSVGFVWWVRARMNEWRVTQHWISVMLMWIFRQIRKKMSLLTPSLSNHPFVSSVRREGVLKVNPFWRRNDVNTRNHGLVTCSSPSDVFSWNFRRTDCSSAVALGIRNFESDCNVIPVIIGVTPAQKANFGDQTIAKLEATVASQLL